MRKLLFILPLVLIQCIYSDSLSVLFLGDTYFGESYQTNPRFNDGENVIEKYGYGYFFENVKGLLKNSSHTFLNLETSLYPKPEKDPLTKPYSHWSYGNKTIQYLSKYGVDAVTLGNNHVMDYGIPGFTETVMILDSFGIKWFGAGINDSLAELPYTRALAAEDFKFELGVFGGFEYRESYEKKYDFYANTDKPGINVLKMEKMIAAVKILRDRNPEIFIVFFPHWGKNYRQAMDYQKEMAHALINAGVDLIIGHGAHTVQEAEYYNGKWIIYNIGNFIFNAPGRYKSTGAKPYGLMAELVIAENNRLLRLHPVFTDNLRNDYQLRPLTEDEFNDCFDVINKNKIIKPVLNNKDYIEIVL